jgi:predicted RNase H-like HicB family nuclease
MHPAPLQRRVIGTGRWSGQEYTPTLERGSDPGREAFDKGAAMIRQLTAIIEKENDGYVALCPEVDVASQGDTVGEARRNLQEALELFFEMASEDEIGKRLHEEVYITQVEVAVG